MKYIKKLSARFWCFIMTGILSWAPYLWLLLFSFLLLSFIYSFIGKHRKKCVLLACSVYSGHRLFDRGSRSSTRHNSVFVDIWWRDAARVSFIPFWPNYYPAIFNSCCSFCILLKNIFRFVCSFELKWSLNSSLDTQNLGWECGVRSHPGKSDLMPIKRRKMVKYSGE